jgi:3-hydroxyacyl-CoA dehydrogenase
VSVSDSNKAPTDIKTVAVLGSGIMGAGIAALFADRGITVQLYDLKKEIVEGALKKLGDPKAKIPLIMSHRSIKRIQPYALEEMGEHLKEADFIIEAVPEVPSIKKAAFESVDKARRPGSIVATNTSGLSVSKMGAEFSEDFRKHFLGVHFFNPVRYMALVELISTDETAPEVVAAMDKFFTVAGKTTVVGRDTPNFIGNRIGVYAMMKTMELQQRYGFTVEEIDMITGPAIGSPKSGTFRLSDMVGIDTLVHVCANAYQNCQTDESRSVYDPPQILKDMVEKKMLGDKTGGGFYKKDRDEKGKRVILALDLKSMEYRPTTKPKADAIRVARSYQQPGDRLKALAMYDQEDKVARCATELVLAMGAYALNRVGEITESAADVDEAMRSGFGKELGPIESLDAIGLHRAQKLMKTYGIKVPTALREALEKGVPLSAPKPVPEGAISLTKLQGEGRIVRENLSARLVDLGDGVLCCELNAKMVPTLNPVDDYVISMMAQAHEEILSGNFKALVISNQASNFCAGANLMMILELAKAKRFKEIEGVAKGLQDINMANLYAPFPVVTAPHGMTLGGGLEITMGGQRRVAYAELYTGLVEVGVGVVPAGGGCYFLLRQLLKRSAKRQPGPMPAVMDAIGLIGFGVVSKSAYDAQEKGLINKDDVVVFSKAKQIAEAKKLALSMLVDFKPLEKEDLVLPGIGGRLVVEQNLNDMLKQKKLTEHSARIAMIQARILTGGDTASVANPVSPETILELEREGFVELCAHPMTQARMGFMLKKGKPLIN